jgi:hypothetical protein
LRVLRTFVLVGLAFALVAAAVAVSVARRPATHAPAKASPARGENADLMRALQRKKLVRKSP